MKPAKRRRRSAAGLSQLDAHQWQGFAGITGVVGKRAATDAAGLIFPPDADEERMQPCRLGSLEHGNGARPRRNHPAARETDPLAFILTEQLSANGPVFRLVVSTVRVNLASELRGQLVGDAFHWALGSVGGPVAVHQHPDGGYPS